MTLEVFPIWMLYREFTVPIGSVVPFAGRCDPSNPSTNPPSGWLVCDGRAVSRKEYNKLFKIIGTTYGAGDGTETFNLPNYTHSTDSSGTFRPGYIKGTAPIYNATTERYSWTGADLPYTTQTEEFNLDLITLGVQVDASIGPYSPTTTQWQVVLGASNDNTHSHSSATPDGYRYTYIDDANYRTATHDTSPRSGKAQLHLPGKLRKHNQSVIDIPPIPTTISVAELVANSAYRFSLGAGCAIMDFRAGPAKSIINGGNNDFGGFAHPSGNNSVASDKKHILFGSYNTSTHVSYRKIEFQLDTTVAEKITLKLIAGNDSNGGERPDDDGTEPYSETSSGGRDESLFCTIRNLDKDTTRTVRVIPTSKLEPSGWDSKYGVWKDYDINLESQERDSRVAFILYMQSSDPRIRTETLSGGKIRRFLDEANRTEYDLLSGYPDNFKNALDNYGLFEVRYNANPASSLGVQRPYGSYYDALGTPEYTTAQFNSLRVWNHSHGTNIQQTSNAGGGIIGGVSLPDSGVSENQTTIGSFAAFNGKFRIEGSPSLSYELRSGCAVYGENAGPDDININPVYREFRGLPVGGTERYVSVGRFSSKKPSDGVRSFSVYLDTRYANVVEFEVIAGDDFNGGERPQNLGEGLYCQINNNRIVRVIPSNQEWRSEGGTSDQYDDKYGNWHTFRLPLTGLDENKDRCEFRFFSKAYSMPEFARELDRTVISAADLVTKSDYSTVIGDGCALFDFRDGPAKDIDHGNGKGNNEWGGFEHPKEDGYTGGWIRSGDNSKSSSKKYISLGTYSSPHVAKREIKFKLNTNAIETITFTLIAGNDKNGGERPNNIDVPNDRDESLFLEINNPDGGTRDKIMLVPCASRYVQIARSDTTSLKTDDAKIADEWNDIYGFWRDYVVTLKDNERGPNVQFKIYAESLVPPTYDDEIVKTTVSVTPKNLEFDSGGPLSADTKGGTYGLRISNGVDVALFNAGPGKDKGTNEWSGFSKPTNNSSVTYDRLYLFGAFSYVIKNEDMTGIPGNNSILKSHVATRRMRFQLDVSASSFIEFNAIAGTNFNGGEAPEGANEGLYLEILDSSGNSLRKDITIIPSLADSGLNTTNYNAKYGVWDYRRIDLNQNERTKNTIFIVYSKSVKATNLANEIDSSLHTIPGFNDYQNSIDQYGLTDIRYQRLFAASLPNVTTNYLNARDHYGLFQVALLRDSIYPTVNPATALEAGDVYGLKAAETKYDINVKWYANTQRSVQPILQEFGQYKIGRSYLRCVMNEGCAIYPERRSTYNPAPGKNIDPYGKGVGNNEYGGFEITTSGNPEFYLSFGTFNNPIRTATRSATFIFDTIDVTEIDVSAIAGTNYNGGEAPNNVNENLYLKINGGTERLIIPSTEKFNQLGPLSFGLGFDDTYDDYFGKWQKYTIPGDWFPKQAEVTFEFYTKIDPKDGPVADISEIEISKYPSSWKTVPGGVGTASTTFHLTQLHRNWRDSYAIKSFNFRGKPQVGFTYNNGCSVQKFRNGPGKDWSIGGKPKGDNEFGGFKEDGILIVPSSGGNGDWFASNNYLMFGSYSSTFVAKRNIEFNVDTRGAVAVELAVIAGTDYNGGERPDSNTDGLYARIGGSSGRRVEVIPSYRNFVAGQGGNPGNSELAYQNLYGKWHSFYIYLTESERVQNLSILVECNVTAPSGTSEWNQQLSGWPTGAPFDPTASYKNAFDTYGLAFIAPHYSQSCLWNFGEKTSLVAYKSGPISVGRGTTTSDANSYSGFDNKNNTLDTESKSYLMFGHWAPIVGSGVTDGSAVGGVGAPSSPFGYRTISFKTNTERIKELGIRLRQGNDSNGAENPNPLVPSEKFEVIVERGSLSTPSKSGTSDANNDLGTVCRAGGGKGGVKGGTQSTVGNVITGKGGSGTAGNAPKTALTTEATGGAAGLRTGTSSAASGVNLDGTSSALTTKRLLSGSSSPDGKTNIWFRDAPSGSFTALNGGIDFRVKTGYGYGGTLHPGGKWDERAGDQQFAVPLTVSGGGGAVRIKRGSTITDYTTPGTYLYLVPTGVDTVDIVCIGGGGSGYQASLVGGNYPTASLNDSGGSGGAYAYVDGYKVTAGTQLEITVGAGGAAVTGGSSDGQDSFVKATAPSGSVALVENSKYDDWSTYSRPLAGDERFQTSTVFFRNYVDELTFNDGGAEFDDPSAGTAPTFGKGINLDFSPRRNFALASDIHGVAYIDVEYEKSTNLPLPHGTNSEGDHAHVLSFQLDRGHDHLITGQSGNATVTGQDSNIEPRHLPMVYIIHTG